MAKSTSRPRTKPSSSSVPRGQKRARLGQTLNALAARRAARGAAATGFTSQPEPRTIGSLARGRQLIGGNFLLAGFLIEGRDRSPWDLAMPDPAFEEELHGFGWLDDLAAVGDRTARARAQDWVFGWIDRYGRGTGAGWQPDLTGRRVIRWINNALMILHAQDKPKADAFFAALGAQTTYLAKRWKAAPPGLPRFEALTGLIYASLSLTGMQGHSAQALAGLAAECATQIDIEGGIATRNPEELLEVLTLLNWAKAAIETTGGTPSAPHLSAIERITPTLRALRHADGGLARFHGGEAGLPDRIDQTLVETGLRQGPTGNLAMGFARLHGGGTTLIMDADKPPKGPASSDAHASTLAFELTSRRRPIIVNCGSGAQFGRDWHRAGRATPSHSTLALVEYSSSRLGPERSFGRSPHHWLEETPELVWAVRDEDSGQSWTAGHDGYSPTHGLTHLRRLSLSTDGKLLEGLDSLSSATPQGQKRLLTILEREGLHGIPYQIRFHLHPDADATLDMGGHAVSVVLKSGEIWVFRHDEQLELALEPSVFLEKGRLRPRATQQIVLSGRLLDEKCQISWTFTKAQDRSAGIRDLQSGADRDDSDT
ncbi:MULTISPECIES: heparinase II/III family protein [Thioclava]|uniref:Heparinase II/III family protein n=1 Tax=Thioclava kandeliae TaxID=3070818 RepID=A0ABV1SJR2_9RHOB